MYIDVGGLNLTSPKNIEQREGPVANLEGEPKAGHDIIDNEMI